MDFFTFCGGLLIAFCSGAFGFILGFGWLAKCYSDKTKTHDLTRQYGQLTWVKRERQP